MISQAMTSHDGMGDAAVETADTGCLQHCIAKAGRSCHLGHEDQFIPLSRLQILAVCSIV